MKFYKRQNYGDRKQIGSWDGVGGELQRDTRNFESDRNIFYFDCGDSDTTIYISTTPNCILKSDKFYYI